MSQLRKSSSVVPPSTYRRAGRQRGARGNRDAFRVRADQFPYTTTIETKQIYSTSQLLSTLTGQGVQVTKAIVGRNAFAHEAGIHQDGILKDRRTYEIMAAEDVDPERREPLTDGPQA